jgi:methyl-accepting chemotaxis protein
MSLKDEISAAVGAHGLWKGRLRDAIQTGRSDATPQGVRVDNQCKFGQWLYGASIPGAAKASASYHECLDLHKKFHVAAAHVLELALAGKKAAAEAAMHDGGEFATLSHTLTDAMMRWQKSAA